jgi:hypothetical protein
VLDPVCDFETGATIAWRVPAFNRILPGIVYGFVMRYTAAMRRSAGYAQYLSVSLGLGSLYDVVLALMILVADPGLMQLLAFPPPADRFLFRLSALPLILFPIVYISAARDPVGRPWAVRASILLRALGGLVLGLLALAHRPPGLHVYLAAAAIDLVWAVVHMALWSRVKHHR